MSRPVAIIQQEIRDLSLAEKEEVLRTLLEELDGPPNPDVEAAWLLEVERRAAEIDAGKVKCIPAEEVFRKLDAQQKQCGLSFTPPQRASCRRRGTVARNTAGLGSDLKADTQRVIQILCETPVIAEPLGQFYRRMPRRRFPFALI